MGLSREMGEKMSILSERLLELRKSTGLSQEDLTKKMKVGYRSYRRYEAGEREPNASTLIQMADFYGVTIDYLVGRTDRKD